MHQNPLLPTPVKAHHLEVALDGYLPSVVDFLVSGFKCGFPLHFEGIRTSFEANNLVSANQLPRVVDVKLQKEVNAGRVAGPFQDPPFSLFRVSPLGVVPKKVPGEFRIIHHLSYPKGSSVNDGISPENTSVQYARVDDAIQLLKTAGRNCFLAKTDIKNAFRIVPIQSSDHNLLGMKWNDLYYYDKCMPMGCASSCKTFEIFSTAIEWIAKNKLLIDLILHLLDDFLIVAPSYDLCSAHLKQFLQLCEFLGVPIAPEKTCGPSQVLSFAGIELDSTLMEARLPVEKLDKCNQAILAMLSHKKTNLKDLQSLIGLLQFACSVIVPGRPFLRRLIDLTIGVKSNLHFIRLTREVKQDLLVWKEFLSAFNGKSFFLNESWLSSEKLNLFTDAAGGVGFGAVFGSEWIFGAWPPHWLNRNIAILEFFPIVLALYLWGDKMANRCILFFSDNEAVVQVINKQSCKDKTLMFFVRKMVSVCLTHNIVFRAKHLPGVENKLADALSRLQVQHFKLLAPLHMAQQPTVIPDHLQPANWPI